MISWSLSMPMQRNATQIGMSFVNTLCFRYNLPFFSST